MTLSGFCKMVRWSITLLGLKWCQTINSKVFKLWSEHLYSLFCFSLFERGFKGWLPSGGPSASLPTMHWPFFHFALKVTGELFQKHVWSFFLKLRATFKTLKSNCQNYAKEVWLQKLFWKKARKNNNEIARKSAKTRLAHSFVVFSHKLLARDSG